MWVLSAVDFLSLFQSTLPTRGSDRATVAEVLRQQISIHAPHEGERPQRSGRRGASLEFQSTLPTRGSDRRLPRLPQPATHFNPRSPRGGATRRQLQRLGAHRFQSTLPTRGSDVDRAARLHRSAFQSTLPTRGSDQHILVSVVAGADISIHAPHEGERPRSASS